MFQEVEEGRDPQETTLALYTVLQQTRAEWRGALILCCGLGPLGSAVALAANAVGAACLVVEPDALVCRAAMRAGACDFFVNTVDEALRVLKNEIRKRQPLSVALELGIPVALEELLERGVLPQLFTTASPGAEGGNAGAILRSAAVLARDGSCILDLDGRLKAIPGAMDASSRFYAWLEAKGMELRSATFGTAAALKAYDARLNDLLAPDDPRRMWLAAAPRLFPRDRPYRRAMLLTREEALAVETGS